MTDHGFAKTLIDLESGMTDEGESVEVLVARMRKVRLEEHERLAAELGDVVLGGNTPHVHDLGSRQLAGKVAGNQDA